MSVDIIIPVWNQALLTVRCLQTIRMHSTGYRVIVIDNGSQPQEWESVAHELENHENALVITNPQNRGFVKAVNQGLKAATAPYIVLMNNDTEAVSGWIEKLMEPLKASVIIAMSGPLTTTTESWQGKYPKGQKGWVLRESGMLAFFCTMFKRSLFDEIGLLDERFGLGFGDDDDFCHRTLKAGYKLALVQDLVIPHHHRASFRKAFSEKEIKEMQQKAMLMYHEKHSKANGTTDVVYALGTGSNWDNNEIRYSIRSFYENFADLRNIVVVGDKPAWMKNVVHIPFIDTPNVNKDCRIMHKIMAACKDPRVSENFIFCNDDMVLLQPVEMKDFKGWHNGQIMYDAEKDQAEHRKIGSKEDSVNSKKPSLWFEYVYNTGRELKKRGLPDNNYDRAHCPQPVNKSEFIEVMAKWDMVKNNYTVTNIYNNSTKIFEGENIAPRAVKIYSDVDAATIRQLCDGKVVLNYNDTGLSAGMKTFLASRFVKISNCEGSGLLPDKTAAVREWMKGNGDYDEGVAIFRQFAPRNVRLIRWFEIKRNTPIAEKKLRQTLQIWMK